MPTKTVQFRKIEDVISTYENADIPAFAIFTGNQMFLDCETDDIDEGAEKLRGLLQMLKDNESAAIYSVMLYRKVPTDGITNKTPYNGSFNFRLTDEIVGYGTPSDNRSSGYNELKSQIGAIQTQLDKLFTADEELIDEEKTIADKVLGFISQPALQPVVKALAEKLGGMISGIGVVKNKEMEVVKNIAGVPGEMVNNLTSDEKIAQAIKLLKEELPDCADLLLKLAQLSKKNPLVFKIAVNQLRNL